MSKMEGGAGGGGWGGGDQGHFWIMSKRKMIFVVSSMSYFDVPKLKCRFNLGLNFGTFEALFQTSKLVCVLFNPIFGLKVPQNLMNH